jgi:hypothetical protein
MQHDITLTTFRIIRESTGLTPRQIDKRDVLDAIAQHGKPYTGNVRHWAIDPATGCYSASRVLIGWIEEEHRVSVCDARAAARFERDAYGYDE